MLIFKNEEPDESFIEQEINCVDISYDEHRFCLARFIGFENIYYKRTPACSSPYSNLRMFLMH